MSTLDLKQFQQQARAFMWVSGVLICAVLLLSFRQVWVAVFKPPPFIFTQGEYRATQPVVCPGGTLEWTPRLVVRRAPTLLVVARTVWSIRDQRTVHPDLNPKFFIWTELETGKPVARPVRLTVPALPPGAYEIRSAATAFNSDAATYRVPFIVPQQCKEQL